MQSKRYKEKHKWVIGITGGVGAGKSRILAILKDKYQAQLIVADEVAHELMEPEQDGYKAVVENLGKSFLKEDGRIDREKLSKLIFHDKEALASMNRIIHPLVWKSIKIRISASQATLIVIESAIMNQEQDDIYDEMWYVYTSEENRLNRLLKNRGYTREHSRSIMENQADDKTFRSFCSRIIDNNGSVEDVEAQIAAILRNEG